MALSFTDRVLAALARALNQTDAYNGAIGDLTSGSGGGTTNFLRADGTWAPAGGGGGAVSSVSTTDTALTISPTTGAVVVSNNDFSSSHHGTVPSSGGGTSKFLRADGTWSSPLSGGANSRGATWSSSTGPLVLANVSDVPVAVPLTGTITDVTILTKGGTGSCQVDIWKTPFAGYPPTVANSIVASAPPTISSGISYLDTTLTGWTTACTLHDTLMFHLVSTSVFTEIVVQLTINSGGAGGGAVSSVSTTDPALTITPITGAVVVSNNDFGSSTHGTVPASGGGTAHFLRADGTWSAPPGTSPLTTKGDIFGYDTGNNRIPVGTDGQVLTADSTKTLGVKWAPGGGGTPAALTPATIANLIHWSETDVIAVPSGGHVQYLPQRDPYRTFADNCLAYPNTGNPAGPTVDASTLNGLPVLNFPGTADGNMQCPASGGWNLGSAAGSVAAIGTGACTVFAVVKPTAEFSLLSGSNTAFQIAASSTGIYVESDNSVVIGVSSSGLTYGSWQQFNVTYSNATGVGAFRLGRASVGGFTNTVQKPSAVTFAAFYNSATGAGTENLNGLFAALIIYTRVLTAGEITSVENYIFNKYGV